MTDDTRREFSALIARLAVVPRAERSPILSRLLPYLANPEIPPPLRIGAAARALKVLPDRDRPVRRIARALTTGLSRSRALERLWHLQHQVETCESLDRFIDEREKRLRLKCPRCDARLPRGEMVGHLWHVHEPDSRTRKSTLASADSRSTSESACVDRRLRTTRSKSRHLAASWSSGDGWPATTSPLMTCRPCYRRLATTGRVFARRVSRSCPPRLRHFRNRSHLVAVGWQGTASRSRWVGTHGSELFE